MDLHPCHNNVHQMDMGHHHSCISSNNPSAAFCIHVQHWYGIPKSHEILMLVSKKIPSNIWRHKLHSHSLSWSKIPWAQSALLDFFTRNKPSYNLSVSSYDHLSVNWRKYGLIGVNMKRFVYRAWTATTDHYLDKSASLQISRQTDGFFMPV